MCLTAGKTLFMNLSGDYIVFDAGIFIGALHRANQRFAEALTREMRGGQIRQ